MRRKRNRKQIIMVSMAMVVTLMLVFLLGVLAIRGIQGYYSPKPTPRLYTPVPRATSTP